jgi:hypothetical protein
MAESDAERAARVERERAAALDAYEARYATVHAAAIAVLNIKVLVPLVLDRAADNYNRWHALFLTVLGKYALTDHVLSDVVNTDRPAWVQMNCTVLTWIYGTIHADLQQSTMNRKPNARGAWTYLENEFLGQRESRALLLSAEFRTAKQGSSSVTDYCRRLETMAATLGDYGDPIGDRTLVLTLLRGLNGKFRPMVSNLKMRQPFPTFEEARTLLLLEEIDIDDIAASEAAGASDPPASSTSTALVAAPRPPTGRHGQDGQGGHGQGRQPGQSSYGQGGQAGHGHQRTNRRRGGRGRNQQHSVPQPQAQYYNPWAGHVQFWPCPPNASGTPFRPPPAAFAAQQQYVQQPYSLGPPPGFSYGGPPPPQQLQQQPWTPMQGPSWDPSALVSNFNAMTLTPPPSGEWYADSGAGAHMVNNAGILSSLHPPSSSSPSSIIVGNGASLPVTSIGSHSFPTERRPLVLSNVLVSPSIIKNLISVRRFTTDNNCSIEFDPFGLSVKDLQTRSVIARCNSTGDLYPFFPIPSSSTTALATTTTSSSLWHRRLGHLGHAALSKLISSNAISCNKHIDDHICHACQLGRHVRLPFSVSNSRAVNPFDLIHCDLWTSPVVSVSGYKYY